MATPEIVEAMVDDTKTPAALAKPWGKWVQGWEYDPDKGYRADDYMASANTWARRFAVVRPKDGNLESLVKRLRDEKEAEKVALSVPGTPSAFVPVDVAGTVLMPIQESKRGGIRWKPIQIMKHEEFGQLMESRSGKTKRLLEQFGPDVFGGSSDQPLSVPSSADSTELIDTEFIPIMSGPFFKQLYFYDYLYMHARAFEMVNHSALAAAAVKIMTRFVLGRGVNFHIKHKQAREVWEEFWERNNMRVKLRELARDLPWQGELMLRVYERARGYVTLKHVDPSVCWEVVTDPEDIEHVYFYHLQYPTPYQIWVAGKIPIAKYIIQQVPATNIIHIKINCSSQEKRGRSDLMPAMPWIKRFNDYYSGQTLKAVLEANLVFKVKVKGDQADVDAFLANPALTQLPPPGGIWIENEAVDLTATSTQLTGGRGSQGIGGQLAAATAASMNLPNEYFNIEAGAGGARATALVRTDPAVKTIEERQQILRETVEMIYDHVMAEALDAGRIDKASAREDPDAQDGEEEPDADLKGLLNQVPPDLQRRIASKPVQAVLVRNVR